MNEGVRHRTDIVKQSIHSVVQNREVTRMPSILVSWRGLNRRSYRRKQYAKYAQ